MAKNKVGGRIQGDPNARSYKENGGKFWRGTHGNAAKLGKELSDALDGQGTSSWGMTRRKIVKALAGLLRRKVVDSGDFFSGIGVDVVTEREKAKKILLDMDKGKMPPCNESQRTGDDHARQKKTHLHHRTPKWKGGAVHALWNLLFVSPKKHNDVLTPKAHQGEYYGGKEERRRDAQEARKRAQIKKKK